MRIGSYSPIGQVDETALKGVFVLCGIVFSPAIVFVATICGTFWCLGRLAELCGWRKA